MLWGLFGDKQFFNTAKDIENTRLRVAAELVDQVEGKKGDRIVTASDLKKAASDLAAHDAAVKAKRWDKSPLKALMPQEIEIIRENLPELNQFLHTKEKPLPKPFCTSLLADALADEKTRATAMAVIRCFDPDSNELNLGQLLSARDVMKGKDIPNKAAIPAIKAALESGAIDPDEFQKVDLFMLTGKGGLISWGPIQINGREFTDCYRLPVADTSVLKQDPTVKIGPDDGRVWQSFALESVSADGGGDAQAAGGDSQPAAAGDTPDAQPANGDDNAQASGDDAQQPQAAKADKPGKKDKAAKADKADQSDNSDNADTGDKKEKKSKGDDGPNDLDKLINAYEARFQRTGYDRIYIKEGDKLFVALNPKGPIEDIQAFYRVTMHHDRHLAASGEVIRVVDTNNSVKEATVYFWRDVIRKGMGALRSLFTKRLDENIGKAANAAVDGTPAADKGNVTAAIVMGGGVALTSVAAAINVGVAVATVGVSAAAVTGANVIDYATTPLDKAPYYHAAGVTVNRSEPIRY